jgi:charged multivesicular body protein 4
MMASFMSYFTGRRDTKQSARDAIVALREQLITIEKKEEHLQRQIAQDVATAKANAVSNKPGALFCFKKASNCTAVRLTHAAYIIVATAALRRKKMHESDLEKLAGTRLQLEVQVNTLESANINANTLDVMRKGANALKGIHDGLCVLTPPPPINNSPLSFFFHNSTLDKVDATMNSINEQRDIANEISNMISDPTNAGFNIDEVRAVCMCVKLAVGLTHCRKLRHAGRTQSGARGARARRTQRATHGRRPRTGSRTGGECQPRRSTPYDGRGGRGCGTQGIASCTRHVVMNFLDGRPPASFHLCFLSIHKPCSLIITALFFIYCSLVPISGLMSSIIQRILVKSFFLVQHNEARDAGYRDIECIH